MILPPHLDSDAGWTRFCFYSEACKTHVNVFSSIGPGFTGARVAVAFDIGPVASLCGEIDALSGCKTVVASAGSEYNRCTPGSSAVAFVLGECEICDVCVPTTCSSGEVGCGAGRRVGSE